MQQHLVKGFSDPVQHAQQVFRQTLTALSEPGVMVDVPSEAVFPNLYPSTTALLLTLLDQETSVWLSDRHNGPALTQNLSFHCGCPVVSEQASAQFAVYELAEFLSAEQHDFSLGNERYPDQSATLIIQLPEGADLEHSVWQGPGILNERVCSWPIPEAFWAKRQALIAFPRGVDFIFTTAQGVLGLPRTTLVKAGEESVCM